MKKNIITVISCILFVCTSILSSAEEKADTVKLEGKLLNFGSTAILEDFSDIQFMVPDSYHRIITLSEDSFFTISFPLQSPGYFRLGRNKLYLSPGDNMQVRIDKENSEKSDFTGKGSAANLYLRNTSFPKGGSYVKAGANIKSTPEEMLSFILNSARVREKELSAVKGVSADFVNLERARIKADIIMSIDKVPGYTRMTFRNKPDEFRQSYINEFNKISQPCKDSILKNFVDPDFLQIEVYRDIFKELPLDKGVSPEALQIMNDWKKANSLAISKIKPLNNKKEIEQLRNASDSLKTKRYREILNVLLDDKMKFGTGDPARDITVRKTDGTSATLSGLKGKVIYIDIWATWCGPCMGEMPYLESLKKNYGTNPDVAIVSLSVDDTDKIWLKDLEKRKPDGIQWRIDRPKLSEYEVLSIPRFILIDKSFTIADMNATRPSDPALIKQIDMLLSK